MPSAESKSEYHFHPENEKGVDLKRGVDITVVGSREDSPEVNDKLFGKHIAERFKEIVLETQKSNKRLVFDMATGNSPKAVWPEIQDMVEKGELDLSNVIVIGHEEAWGDFQPGDHSDFDAYRKKEFFTRNNLDIEPITDIQQVSGEEIKGNFVPMRQSDNVTEAIAKYRQLLVGLKKREDTVFFGLYGVGKDGHIAEIQSQNMGVADTNERLETYQIDINDYSIERGAFRWSDESGEGFRPEDNIFSDRKKMSEPDVEVGRAQTAGYTGIKYAAGLGWKVMISEDTIIIAYNGSSKKLAFELTIEGSFSGPIVDDNGETVTKVKADYGEGENIYHDLEQYVKKLIAEGVLNEEKVDKIMTEAESSSKWAGLKCRGLFRAIYSGFDDLMLEGSDPRYQELWKFTNRYIGKRSPVARLVKMRALAGRKTELVITPTDLEGTRFEELVSEKI